MASVTLSTFESGSNRQLAAAANAAQHLFDSLLPRKLLGLQLIKFSRAPLRPWPDILGPRNRACDVASVGERRRLYPLRRNGRLWGHVVLHPLHLRGFGAKHLRSRPAAAKAGAQADQQKRGAKSNHQAHHTTSVPKYHQIACKFTPLLRPEMLTRPVDNQGFERVPGTPAHRPCFVST